MKLYEISYLNNNSRCTTEIYTEADIIEEYWKYWYGKMVDKFEAVIMENGTTVEELYSDLIKVLNS